MVGNNGVAGNCVHKPVLDRARHDGQEKDRSGTFTAGFISGRTVSPHRMYPSTFKNAIDLILRLRQNLAGDLPEVENQDGKGGARIYLSCERASGKCQGQGYQYTRHPQTLAESVAGTGCSPSGLRSTILIYSHHAILPAECRARGQRLPEHQLTQWMEASSSIKRKLEADKSVTLSNHES
jgi:hypothetical protein